MAVFALQYWLLAWRWGWEQGCQIRSGPLLPPIASLIHGYTHFVCLFSPLCEICVAANQLLVLQITSFVNEW